MAKVHWQPQDIEAVGHFSPMQINRNFAPVTVEQDTGRSLFEPSLHFERGHRLGKLALRRNVAPKIFQAKISTVPASSFLHPPSAKTFAATTCAPLIRH
jgi:hypothetical protein